MPGPTFGPTTAVNVNATSADDEHLFTANQRIFLGVLHSVILLVNILANSFNIIGIFTIYKSSRRKHTPLHFFVVNLAIADIAAGICYGVDRIVHAAVQSYVAGTAMCRIQQYVSGVFYNAASLMVICLAVDRVEAVTRPFRFSSKWTVGRVLVVVSWVLAALLGVPWSVCYHVVQSACRWETYCVQTWHGIQMWILYNYMFVFFVPAAAIIICYSTLFFFLHKRMQTHLFDDARSNHHDHSGYGSNPSEMHLQHTLSVAKRKALVMSGVISTTFIVCWSFVVIINFLEVFQISTMANTSSYVRYSLNALGTLTHAVNPIVYNIFSGESWVRWAVNSLSSGKRARDQNRRLQTMKRTTTQRTGATADTEVTHTLHTNHSSPATPMRRLSGVDNHSDKSDNTSGRK